VTGLFASQNPTNPSYDFMRGRVGRFVEVDNSGFDVRFQISFERGGTGGNGSEMRTCAVELTKSVRKLEEN